MKTRTFHVTDIKWDTDGKPVNIPTELVFTVNEDAVTDINDDDEIEALFSEKLSAKFGFCHDGFVMTERDILPMIICNYITENDRTSAEVKLYNGKTYKVRVIYNKDGEEFLIAGDEIDNVIHPGEWGSENDGFDPANPKAAEIVYDSIFFFTDNTTLDYTDELLRKEMHQENPDYGFDY